MVLTLTLLLHLDEPVVEDFVVDVILLMCISPCRCVLLESADYVNFLGVLITCHFSRFSVQLLLIYEYLVQEFLALPRADAIHLLAQYNGNAETVIQQIFA